MKIYRKSGVEEFMSGVNNYDVNNMPIQDELTQEQADQIRSQSLHTNDSSQRLSLYLKYPDYAYFTLWDLSKCIDWKIKGVHEAFEIIVNKGKIGYGVPQGLADWVYKGLVDNFDRLNFDNQIVGEILATQSGYPQWFIEFISEKLDISKIPLYAIFKLSTTFLGSASLCIFSNY